MRECFKMNSVTDQHKGDSDVSIESEKIRYIIQVNVEKN